MRSVASLTLAFATAFATVFALPAAAQDLPGRVGRVAHIEGTAAIYQEPEEGWEKAYVNSPVTSENSLWTEPGSRAEMRVGGTAVRMEEATQLDLSRLDDNLLDAFVPRGTVSVRVRHFDRNDRVIFNTPHARFAIRANGRYRVDVDPEREESRLTVFTGEARVGSDSGRIRVQAGKTVRVFGGSSPSYVVENAFNDPFDRWAETRDSGWVESRSLKYVSTSMTGYEDLDRYGSWREEPEFGALWYPTRVASDWAPYRHGRWDYVRPWGWTWVDDAPWGYAPFHYGRWVFVRDRWAWSPGRREVRPTWAPALVAWVGGSNFSVGVSSGSPSVGWYPLSPYERYQPWYNASPTYVTQVNVIVLASPQRDDRRQWVDMTRERGITVVNREVVVDRRPVQQSLVAIRPEVARQVQIAAPATVLPSRNEVIQRRQSVRTQVVAPVAAPSSPSTAPGSAPATQRPGTAQAPPMQRGERAGPAARPEFQRRQAVAPPAPEPAKTAPPPVQRVTPPSPAAQQQAREQMLKAREAEVLKSREDQQKAREQQQKASDEQRKARDDQMKGRDAEQQKAREQQQKAVDEQRKAREDQMKGREAEQQKAADEQRKAREDQQKGREAEQQKAREQQMKAREDQQKGRDAEQQKAREDQMKGREAEQQKAREEQMKARAEQQKAVDEQRKARDAQQNQRQQQEQQAQEAAKQRQLQRAQQAEEAAKQQQLQRAQQAEEAAKQQRPQRVPQAREAAPQPPEAAKTPQERAQQAEEAAKQQRPQRVPQAREGAPQPPEAAKTPQERAQQRQERLEREKKAREDKEEEEKKGKAGR